MTITMEGALSKWTNVMKGWQYRWFVLDDSAGIFSYYTSKEKMTRGVRRGCVRLRGALIGIDDEVSNFTEKIVISNKSISRNFFGPNSIFCNFKNGQKSNFELGKSLKLPKMQFHVEHF